jgi:hypothetical protein
MKRPLTRESVLNLEGQWLLQKLHPCCGLDPSILTLIHVTQEYLDGVLAPFPTVDTHQLDLGHEQVCDNEMLVHTS